MAKRQRHDSIQERMVEHLDEKRVATKKKPNVISYFITIPVEDLRVGDIIATKVNARTGQVLARQEVREIDGCARGCRNVHVNGKDCYDRCSTVNIVQSSRAEEGDVLLPDGSFGTAGDLVEYLGINNSDEFLAAMSESEAVAGTRRR
jgi:hypothetical protein